MARSRLTGLVLALVASFLGAVPSDARVLDPDSPPHPILDSIAAQLDGNEIDHLRDPRMAPPATKRAFLAELSAVRLSQLDWENSPWVSDFERNVWGALAAIKGPDRGGSPSEFLSRWRAAPKKDRVFVSFSRTDAESAGKVRSALESAGYTVFTYIRSAAGLPSEGMEALSEVFASAGHHFVIVTDTSKASLGVAVEAWLYERWLRPPFIKPRGGGQGSTGTPNAKRVDGKNTAGPETDVPIPIAKTGDGKPPGQKQRIVDPKKRAATPKKRVVDIYGRKSCSRTTQALEIARTYDVEVRFHDVDAELSAGVVLVVNEMFMPGGDLPLIQVNGKSIQPYDIVKVLSK